MAAIAAAVQSYLEGERRPGGGRRPLPPGEAAPAWAHYGRAELMRQRTTWQLRLAR